MSTIETSLSSKERKESGSHFTPDSLARFLAKQILDVLDSSDMGKDIRLLDPASGDGQLLLAFLQEAAQRRLMRIDVFGFDTSRDAVQISKSRIEESFPSIKVDVDCKDFLGVSLNGDSGDGMRLFSGETESYDVVIANPPYVRTQVLGAEVSRRLASHFNLSGRVDLAYAFLQGIANVLRPGGIAGVIVSNRFMTTKAGGSVRESLLKQFEILHVWDLGDTRLFGAAVLPALLLLRRKNDASRSNSARFTKIYSTLTVDAGQGASSVIDALTMEGLVRVDDSRTYQVDQGKLNTGDSPLDTWRIATGGSDMWLSTVLKHTYLTFGDIGRIRVGVKSTADKVFIRSDWQSMAANDQPELLRPLITHHTAGRFRAIESAKSFQILYPHTVVNGKRIPVNLSEYPRSQEYLEQHRKTLEARKYVRDSGRKWYEIWVPHNPEAWKKPMVVFRDIAESPTFWMNLNGSVVNGDCYWLITENGQPADLLWLALAVGNSSFIEMFYDHRFNNKLYAGRRRFITQYVEKFPLPDPSSAIGREIVKLSKRIFELKSSENTERQEETLDKLVWKSFGLPLEEA